MSVPLVCTIVAKMQPVSTKMERFTVCAMRGSLEMEQVVPVSRNDTLIVNINYRLLSQICKICS